MKQKKMILPAQIGMATDNRSELIGNGFKTPSKAQLLRWNLHAGIFTF
jgi:hypothetical protein